MKCRILQKKKIVYMKLVNEYFSVISTCLGGLSPRYRHPIHDICFERR